MQQLEQILTFVLDHKELFATLIRWAIGLVTPVEGSTDLIEVVAQGHYKNG